MLSESGVIVIPSGNQLYRKKSSVHQNHTHDHPWKPWPRFFSILNPENVALEIRREFISPSIFRVRQNARMTTFAASLKKEIARIARKEWRAEISALRKGSAIYRSEIAEFKRKINALEAHVKTLSRATPRAKSASTDPAETPRGKPGRKVTFGATEFLALRQQLGFTQAQMGKLVGASSLSIYKWESGQVTPRAAQLEKIMAVRKIGKREAKARIQA